MLIEQTFIKPLVFCVVFKKHFLFFFVSGVEPKKIEKKNLPDEKKIEDKTKNDLNKVIPIQVPFAEEVKTNF